MNGGIDPNDKEKMEEIKQKAELKHKENVKKYADFLFRKLGCMTLIHNLF